MNAPIYPKHGSFTVISRLYGATFDIINRIGASSMHFENITKICIFNQPLPYLTCQGCHKPEMPKFQTFP